MATWEQPGPFGENPTGLNNANLALFSQYNQHVPAFRQLLRDHAGDFSDFYNAVETLAGQSRKFASAGYPVWDNAFTKTFELRWVL